MEYRTLGRSGLKVPVLSFGAGTFGGTGPLFGAWGNTGVDEARRLIDICLEAGVNLFDTADVYSDGASERVLGAAIHGRRDQVLISTKTGLPTGDGPSDAGTSRSRLIRAVDDALRRLGTDYIDLLQIHRFDHGVPIEETLEALHDVVRSGKARYIGASSMHAWQFAKMVYTSRLHGWTEFVSMQDHYNLIQREEEREMIPFCIDQGIAVIPWSPLARGRLTRDWEESSARQEKDVFGGTLYNATEDADRAIVAAVKKVAEDRGVPRAQVALAWVAQRAGITAPIVGASKPHHLDDAVAALGLNLSDEEIKALEQAYTPRASAGFD
jgi:aryl-alcohol dehydrogenase-like predicted oxidoreductase